MSAYPWLLLFLAADVKSLLTIRHCSTAIYAWGVDDGFGSGGEEDTPSFYT
jgi:hypothetical protein